MQQAGEDERRENARPEMKKRKVSAFYTGLFGFTSIFFLVGIAFVMWFLVVYMQEDIASLRGLSLIGVILFCFKFNWFIFVPLYGLKGRVFSCIYRGYRWHDYLLEKKHIPAFVDRLHRI